jgi:FixJ family two-component response regulator
MLVSRNVCVIDDDEPVRRALKRYFTSIGWNVVTFPSAEEYLSASGEPADCLVLDVHLPGASGLDLQRLLLEQGRAVPIIFITAYGDAATRAQALAAGAIAFLTKPFDQEVLMDAMTRALDRAPPAANAAGIG